MRRATGGDRESFLVKFIGVPIEPWTPGDSRAFGHIARTMDPREMPEGTPEHVVAIAQGLLDETIAHAEQKAKALRKKKRKKKK